jgi:tRNA (guanine37-N1)-methyltransferase
MKKKCIQVEQHLGEQLRLMLVELGYLDADYPITKDETYLYLPLRHKLSSSELAELKKSLPKLKQVEMELEPVSKKPADLSAALQGTLPEDLHQFLPHSLDIVGEIAIVELNKEVTPFEVQIGDAIMVVNSRVSTVYAKEGSVEGVCRIRPLRLIAGEGQTQTIHTEYGVKLAIDVTQTYFSPRLGTEHDRVASLVRPSEVIVDMFTGVGPFALLAAKRQPVQVFAIDVNPQAIRCLQKSLELNRLVGEVVPLMGDARKIIHNQLGGKANRVIMNLPNDAFSFLDAAAETLHKKGGIIHYYGVVTETVTLESLETVVTNELANFRYDAQITNKRVIRPAAPHEDQIVFDLHLTPQ